MRVSELGSFPILCSTSIICPPVIIIIQSYLINLSIIDGYNISTPPLQ